MRRQKKFLVLFVILIGISVIKFYTVARSFERVDQFRGANIRHEIFSPYIAQSANNQSLSVQIGGKTYSNLRDGLFFSDNLMLMVPIQILKEGLNCSINRYGEEQLILERKNLQMIFTLNSKTMFVNGEQITLDTPMLEKEGVYYLPLQTLSDYVQISYNWDVEKNRVVALDASDGLNYLPSRFDLREKNRMSIIKNQGKLGTCWAFASLSALESTLLPEEPVIFSPDHMSIRNSFSSDQNSGGQYTMGMAYLTAWQGPVLESEDPYGDGDSPDGLIPSYHVQEIQIIEAKDLFKIKESVYKYGGVQTSIYSSMNQSSNNSKFYNKQYFSYCYQGKEKANHDIVIIGWDDNFSRTNFSTQPEGDGAFICQNSWGSSFGEDGIFYISYYDSNIGMHSISYTKIEKPDNYSSIYQSDLCGWVGQLGYNKNSIYASNVYRAKANERLEAAGFYATEAGTRYEVYAVSRYTGPDSLSKGRMVASGSFENAGYYTVPFDHPLNLTDNAEFAIVVHLIIPEGTKPLAVEFASSDFTQTVDLKDGQGYISPDGLAWERVETTQKCNICLKAYTNRVNHDKEWN